MVDTSFVNRGSDDTLVKSLQEQGLVPEELSKAIDKSKLVQVEIQVQGKNGTFTRKQWKKAGDVKSTDKVVGGQAVGGNTKTTMTKQEFDKKYPNGNYQNPEDVYRRNGKNATWKGQPLSNPSVMKQAKADYQQFLKDKAALDANTKTQKASSTASSSGPVDISKFKFTNYRNPDGQNYTGRETFRGTLESVAKETERKAQNVVTSYNGAMTPEKQLRIAFDNINRHSTYRDLVDPSSEQGLKDAKKAISNRQRELIESVKDLTKWDSSQRKWVKDSESKDAGTSQSTMTQKDSKSNKPSLSDIQGYGYDPATATGDPTYLQIGNKGYFKIGNNKWQYSPSQGSALGGTYTDAQISDMISKTSDEVKVMPSAKKNSKSEQQPESKKDTTDKGVLDSKLNPRGYKVGDYLKVKHGRSYTTYQIKSLEKSKDFSGKEHVYLNCIEIMKNGQVYDFNHIITADSELISYKIDEPLTLKDPSGKRSKDNFQQTSAGQKPPAKGYIMEIRTGDSTYRYVYAEKPTKASAIEAYEKAGEKLKSPVIEVIKRSDKTSIDSKSVKDLCVNITKDGEYGLPKAVNVKLSPADAKKKTQEVTKGVSDKKSFMEKAKAQGITWKENDHEGINWMRCCMAMNKHFENGGSFDEK